MILCQNCLHKEIVGALFCSECGAQLIFPNGVPTSSIKPGSAGLRPGTKRTSGLRSGGLPASRDNAGDAVEKVTGPSALDLDSPLALNYLSTGDTLLIKGLEEVILGRVSEGQPVVPDIDLTPYKAYEAGVSRMHASLCNFDQKLTVTDLGSANGTRINGRQITSHIPYPINHGDILTLGKFKIQVLIRNR